MFRSWDHHQGAISSIQLPDEGPRTETCRSIFNVLMCKFFICAVVGIVIE